MIPNFICEYILTFKSRKQKWRCSNETSKEKETQTEKETQVRNPLVMDVVESLSRDLREEVVDMEKDTVLFVSAPYCKLCRQINPAYTSLARISMEEKESNILKQVRQERMVGK